MITATECPTAGELRAFTLGELPEGQSDDLFRHLQACPHCKSELETIGDDEDSLIASLRTPDDLADFDHEPDCQIAVAKALGALALAGETPTSSDLDHLPKSIGEYEIIRPLGRGGMGSVYLARHTKLGREVALKVLAGHRLADPRMRERFDAEMRAVGQLSHPNIVTAHDAREVDGTAVLVTEYIDGLDLGQLVSRIGPLKIADACEIVCKVAAALQYTSDQGFVHRDVKPSNIMISATGEVKLLDLGLARIQYGEGTEITGTEITGTGQAMGTADYVAPEQVSDSRSVDVRADIYSLGCTMFKLLTGHAPFADPQYATAFAKMTAHISNPPPSVGEITPDLPSRLIKLVDLMLVKDPTDRPQTPMSVAEQLAPFTANCDLKQLVNDAILIAPNSAAAATSSSSRPAVTKPWYSRPVPISVAIGAGFLGIVLGLVMGIVITIKYPDGTTVQVPVTPGSDVTIENVPDGQPAGAAATVGQNAIVDDTPVYAPLTFAVLIEKGTRSPDAIKKATEVLKSSDKRDPIVTDAGVWYRVKGDVPAPVTATRGGYRYALADDDRDSRVPWSDLQGHILSAQSGGGSNGIRLEFDEQLAKRLSAVTAKNMNRQLAVVFDNRIVGTPFIRSEIGKSAQITGDFSAAESRWLLQAIGGGLVNPLSRQEPDPQFSAVSVEKLQDWKETTNNLKQLGLGFYNFHAVYKKFPGTKNTEAGSIGVASGQQAQPFSWRVAILPFIDGNKLFSQYRFDEPWDSEANSKLLDKMPAVYRSPRAPKDQPLGHTNYQGFSMENSAIGTGAGISIRDITDGTSNTLLLIESAEYVPWTKPQDLTEIPEFFDGQPISILLADGSVLTKDELHEGYLKKLITRNGGERIQR